MSTDAPKDRPTNLSLVVHSGDFDKVHYALVLAASAAAIGTPATLFFTMGACRALGADSAAWQAMPSGLGGDGGERDAGFAERWSEDERITKDMLDEVGVVLSIVAVPAEDPSEGEVDEA